MANKDYEKPLRSTPGDFDRFIKSSLWYDMRVLIEERIDLLKQEIMFSDDSDMNKIIALKNQMRAFTEMLGVPQYLKDHAHKQQSNKEEDNA